MGLEREPAMGRRANKVATSLSIAQAEVERALACLSLPCGIFTVPADRRREVFTSVSLCPHSVSAWHGAAPLWQRLSCLYHVEIWRSRLGAALPLPSASLAHDGLFLAEEITRSNPTCTDRGTSLSGRLFNSLLILLTRQDTWFAKVPSVADNALQEGQ
ncbi:unnamed protein product [Pleuronectes platessa]|uniref:Uncharacterized protein n=1 Tax=Pleuronectes platessa TaxID=8262 RepID=A0A9N7U2D8_PLEPL|nr:unnamed protein product [Pleuronectes platessa]